MQCRVGCGACCIAPSISSAIPGMPAGKPSGVRCVQLTDDNLCALYESPERPLVCTCLRPNEEMCGQSFEEAMAYLTALEIATQPGHHEMSTWEMSGMQLDASGSVPLQSARVQQAVALLKKYHSCCTAVFATYAPEMGIDETLAARLTQGMPGIGLSGNVCGAVNGAALVISLATTHAASLDDWDARQRTAALIREFVAGFEARYHSTQCRDILGHDISTPEKFIYAREQGYFTLCPEVVEHAIKTLDGVLNTR